MKELIPKDSYGVFADNHDTARVDSLYVAKVFEKEHKNVLRDIEKIIAPDNGLSESFGKLNFELTYYKDVQEKKRPCYALTRDGFMMLIMSYNGAKANRIKELYIRRFNEMESMIISLITARNDFSQLTDSIKFIQPDAKHYVYSNECDMINRIITGYSTKKFRELHNIQKGESIRPYMTSQQLQLLEVLQKMDIGLFFSGLSYQERKQKLDEYAKHYSVKKACIPAATGTHANTLITSFI